MKITTWLIIKAQHAHRAFDGEGARLAGGRWNKIGIPMIYTADSLALAALEILVHLPGRELLKRKFLRIPVRFDSRLVTSFNLIDLPDDWDILPPPDSTQTIGTEWATIIMRRHREWNLRMLSLDGSLPESSLLVSKNDNCSLCRKQYEGPSTA